MPKYDAIPEFGQLVEFITQSEPVLVDGELVYGVVINSVDLVDQPIVEAAESLLADYEKIEILRPIPEVPVEEIPLVVDKIAAVYHSDIAKLATVTSQPKEIVKTYKDWVVGEAVAIGDVRVYPMDHNLYQVIQSHTTQADWDPVTAKALWKRYYEPDDNPWEWIQPLGAHDAYPLGAKVLFEGDVWESTINANVWAPGVTGWKNLTGTTPETYAAFVQPTGAHDAYNIGDKVTFEGHLWESLINANVWSPTVYPAGWRDLGVYP
jgi:hypothetical protein